MRICFVTKYPPIQGGVSAGSFWLARRLAEQGHQVHVVTNGFEVEAEYRMHLRESDRQRLSCDLTDRGGGRVVLRTPDPTYTRPRYVPSGKPDVTRLAGMAMDEIRSHGLEVVLSHYLEPYSVAGHLAASLSDLPHVVRHAGSDFYHLARLSDLEACYRGVLQEATCVLTDPTGERIMRGWGIAPHRLTLAEGRLYPASSFHPDAPPLDVDELLRDLPWSDVPQLEAIRRWNQRPFDATVPVLGIYGKVGEPRGSFDLLDALAGLQAEGVEFNLLAMVGGSEIARFRHSASHNGLRDRIWFLPFLPPWRVPSFLRTCNAVCYLERDFWVARHNPAIPREVLACGVCLVLSGEVAAKQPRHEALQDGRNVVVVEDPKDSKELANRLRAILKDPDLAATIGRSGHELSQRTDDTGKAAGQFEHALLRAIRIHAERPRHRPEHAEAPPGEELLRRAMDFPMGAIVERYAVESGVSPATAKAHEKELKRYLALCALHPEAHYGMAGPVDELWHTFAIFTGEYARFCEEVAGRFIHHRPRPSGETDTEADTYPQFLEDYERVFGEEAPPDIWPRARSFEVLGWA